MCADSECRGLVLTGRNNIFTVSVGTDELLCRLRGKRLDAGERAYNPLAPGDIVTVGTIDREAREGVIEARDERQNSFVRFNRKRNAPQTLAANIDLAVCVASIAEPAFRHRFVDRFLALCEDQELAALVLMTKHDLDARRCEREAEAYRNVGYGVISVSVVDGTGMEELRERVKGLRCVLVGQSGVGKSSLINTLFGEDLRRVASVSTRFRRGRHTTTAARLIRRSGYEIVDTPGIRELDCRTIDADQLDRCYREFRPLLGSCLHDDCAHDGEPGCAVAAAVADGAISSARYESYRRLLSELRASWSNQP
jgi:ribosome biogenesis GTPase